MSYLVSIKYRFGGKTVTYNPITSKETDFFLKTLKEFGIEILSVQGRLEIK